ncbi:metal ABC transporter permease [Anaerolineae bacterium CFX9]|nr:metal ABC transporter permease [Anaerolineae bacterium CFX9]
MSPAEIISLVLTDYTIRNVALGALILGIVSGTLSAFAVLRRQSLLGDTMSHAALPGIILSFILIGERTTLPLLIGAVIAGWLGTLFMQLVTSQTRIKEDSAQGVVLAVFFGFGMALLSWVLRQNNAQHAGLDKFLFGKAAATIAEDVNLMAIVGAGVLVCVAALWKEFKLISFDPGYAHAVGLPVARLNVALTTLIVVVVVIGLQTVGVVLMSAMLVAPGAAARQWTNRLGSMVVLSAVFGALAGVSGALISSFEARLPTGPVIVLCASAIVVVSLIFAPERGLLWGAVRHHQHKRQLHERLLEQAAQTESVEKEAAAS